MFGHKFPYTNFHEMNLDWIVRKIKELEEKISGSIDLPKASKTEYGKVKISDASNNIIDITDGVISAKQYQLQSATTDRLGGVKVGSGLQIENGVLSTTGGGGGGTGSTITVTPKTTTGTNIADISVDGQNYKLYAPAPGPGEKTEVEVTQLTTTGTAIAKISVDGEETTLYAPENGGGGGTSGMLATLAGGVYGYPVIPEAQGDLAYSIETVYINPITGDDSNDGRTSQTAIQTVDKAKALYAASQAVIFEMIICYLARTYTVDFGELQVNKPLVIKCDRYSYSTANVITMRISQLYISNYYLQIGNKIWSGSEETYHPEAILDIESAYVYPGTTLVINVDEMRSNGNLIKDSHVFGQIIIGTPRRDSDFYNFTTDVSGIQLYAGSRACFGKVYLTNPSGDSAPLVSHNELTGGKVGPLPIVELVDVGTTNSYILNGEALVFGRDNTNANFTNHHALTLL